MNLNKKAFIAIEKLTIPTYREPEAEELPMFAENRVHQRTSGDPYPNKIVSAVDREHIEDKEYIAVRLENEYVSVVVLPEIGGRIYSATDKTTGYDFFYKQHVIKPALIGVLGSWVSGGVEFNWPFHHRASGYMACDYTVEEYPDGSVACHLSEHDPIDRMKGIVSVILSPEAKYIETKMRLYNRTAIPHSFLWWENAAVPVNENYQIFFPQDVTYVNFHYLKSRTTFPVAGSGVYNGIPMKEPRDISWHKNTREATSYFASASDYDFFGGYDHGKGCGVVHIGDHHISPGKKMFTWAYGQLSRSWERALTDTDGQYAELMAGSYSDNQPDFSWLAPYETKEFSQYWYPISEIGTPTFANLNCSVKIDREEGGAFIKMQACRRYENARVKVVDGEKLVLDEICDLTPDKCASFELGNISKFVSFEITDSEGKMIAEYTEKSFDEYNMPEPITDMPVAEDMTDADELYLAGVHVDQYRDPAVKPDAYWRKALDRNPNHTPSLIAIARYCLNMLFLEDARAYIERAVAVLTRFNARPESGECYYVGGQIYEALGEYKKAYDYYYRSAYAADCVAKAMTRIAVLDIRANNYSEAERHALWSLDHGKKNSLATACLIIAKREILKRDEAEIVADEYLSLDPLDHLVRFVSLKNDFYSQLLSDPAETCLDIASDLADMGRYADVLRLLEGFFAERPDSVTKMTCLATAYFADKTGGDGEAFVELSKKTEIGNAYPSRQLEAHILKRFAENGDLEAKLLLGCILYHKRHYHEAAELFAASASASYIAKRNLAVAYFSHLDRGDDALKLMRELCEERQNDGQILYETAILMNKMNVSPAEKIALLESRRLDRDDLYVELAKSYNQNGEHEKAIKALLDRKFVSCEGGEHAIADQYIFAHISLGIEAFNTGDCTKALDYFVKGQTLPESLGAGIWNHCKLIPLKYREALCLDKLGREEEAEAVYRYISDTEIEYFSNMHLPELPYYRALSYDRLGEGLKARAMITKYRRIWSKMEGIKDNGFFATTPFFISFVDEPTRLRTSKFLYLTALCDRYEGKDDTADKKMRESYSQNNDNLFALVM